MKDRGIEVIQSEKDFTKQVLKSNKPVLVMFMAKWCGPEQIMHPSVEYIQKTFAERLEVFELNVTDNEALRNQYNIFEIPTFQVFINGKIIDRFSGLKPNAEFIEWLSNIIERFEKKRRTKSFRNIQCKLFLL